ncbi:LacI family DNA-binding transcriptional regulator [Vallitalea pronyensis]|uniref:LacI family DNA-binding transcriptional regulator n=1 Tax=Vallitalea pronyensis TaxID=1348613 RepID=A0A8J8MPV7_9FIRM|nr:LacI family DNA-binding transcriptional regulator [Vallitalea pronyensis]QUI25372.1 LacI family DNA-binding transcriptional regulator [Vallitalea pronyensis]
MRVTIKQIADLAGVSRGTVDKVLNNRVGVSEEVKRRVQRIANELGYRPNIIGKALSFQKRPIVIGVVIPVKSNPFFTEITEGIYKAYEDFKDFGLKIEMRETDHLNSQEQLDVLNEFHKMKVNGIAVPALDDTIIKNKINELVSDNIQVVTFASDIHNSNRLCFVGQDLYKSGQVAGVLMAKLLRNKGNVAIITGSFNMLAHNDRIEGFQSIVDTLPDIKIIDIVECLDEDYIAHEVTNAVIEKHKDIDGFYIAAAGIKGFSQSIEAHNYKDKAIISYDLTETTKVLLRNDVIDFTITQEPIEQGYKVIELLFEYVFKGIVPKEDFIKVKIRIITKENMD